MMDNMVALIYETLYEFYGDLHWWPALTPYEVMVGAVLTQNTAWRNVEKALANFGDRLYPGFVAEVSNAELVEIIRPSGFFNQKALYLKAVTEWFRQYNYDAATVRGAPLARLRSELLATKGVGRETADSILLYAFGFPTFVVDAYTVRLCDRYPVKTDKGYEGIKTRFEESLPHDADVYNNFHAMIVINGKDHCKKNPACEKCPLGNQCGRNVATP